MIAQDHKRLYAGHSATRIELPTTMAAMTSNSRCPGSQATLCRSFRHTHRAAHDHGGDDQRPAAHPQAT